MTYVGTGAEVEKWRDEGVFVMKNIGKERE